MQSFRLILKQSLKNDWKQLLLTTGAITLAVVILLSFTSVFSALLSRANNNAWQYSSDSGQKKVEGIDPVYISNGFGTPGFTWNGNPIAHTLIATTGENSPKLGNMRMPEEGEYYLSPKLKELIDSSSKKDEQSRFGTKFIGTIEPAYLESPDSVAILRGVSKDYLQDSFNTKNKVYSFPSTELKTSTSDKIIMGVIYTGIAIVLIPVILLIAISIKVGSSQRAKRYAALRLIGFTKKQVRFLILAESWLASVVAIILGTMIYILINPLLEHLHFVGGRFWPQDLAITPIAYALIVIAVFALTSVANWWGMRKVETSPLGVSSSDNAEKKPKIWSLLLLAIGIGLLLFAQYGRIEETVSILVFLGAVITTMVGLYFAGPYITYMVSRIVSRLSPSTLVLLGTSYINKHSRSVFRGVGGVVLALFAGSFYLMSVSGFGALVSETQQTALESTNSNTVYLNTGTPTDEKALTTRLVKNIPDITKVTAIHSLNNEQIVLTCAQFKDYFKAGDDIRACDNNNSQSLVKMSLSKTIKDTTINSYSGDLPTNPLSMQYLISVSNPDAVESIRTYLAKNPTESKTFTAIGGAEAKTLFKNMNSSFALIEELSALAYFGIVLTILVAITSLSVSTVGSLIDRRRSLMTLRLVGVTPIQQKIVIIIESLVPLIFVSIASIALGAWYAYIFIDLFANDTLSVSMSPEFIGILLASLVAAILAIIVSIKFLERIVSIDSIRSE